MKPTFKDKLLKLCIHFLVICGVILSVNLMVLNLINQKTLKTKASLVDKSYISVDYTNLTSQKFVTQNIYNEVINSLYSRYLKNPVNSNYLITNANIGTNWAILSASIEPKNFGLVTNVHEEVDEKDSDYFNILAVRKDGKWLVATDIEYEKIQNMLKDISLSEFSIDQRQAFFPIPKTSNLGFAQVPLSSQQNYTNYKLPWEKNEAWFVERYDIANNVPWGWHRDATNWALDFDPPANSSLRILASAPGIVTWMCTTDNPLNEAGIHITTFVPGIGSYGETLRYYHFNKNELNVYPGKFVNQGDFLGRIAQGSNPQTAKCNMRSTNTHLHLGFPHKYFKIQNYEFSENLYPESKKLYSNQNFLPGVNLGTIYDQKLGSPVSNAEITSSQEEVLVSQVNFVPEVAKSLVSGKTDLTLSLENFSSLQKGATCNFNAKSLDKLKPEIILDLGEGKYENNKAMVIFPKEKQSAKNWAFEISCKNYWEDFTSKVIPFENAVYSFKSGAIGDVSIELGV